ncbi:uncharacterized protein [Narcine bancroftii]|uniref:uncharacterized protein isoform X1 n=1 Tax=Narcine bancroftii TaxID=1343680 RepID=UPI003830FF94
MGIPMPPEHKALQMVVDTAQDITIISFPPSRTSIGNASGREQQQSSKIYSTQLTVCSRCYHQGKRYRFHKTCAIRFRNSCYPSTIRLLHNNSIRDSFKSHNGFFDIHWHNSGPRVEKWQLQTPKVIKSLEPEHLGLEVTSPHAWHSLSGHMSKIKTMGAPCHLEADIRDLETTKRVLRDACLVNKGDDQRLQKLCPDQFKMATKIKENGVQIQNKTTLSDFGRNSAYLPRQNHGVKVGIFLRTELINWTVG